MSDITSMTVPVEMAERDLRHLLDGLRLGAVSYTHLTLPTILRV